MNKTITFAIPCYNSAEYMDNCIQHLVDLNNETNDIEIIIVDDGSQKDNTFEKAKQWVDKHPNIIRAVHQENGGHGEAVNKGLEKANGLYYKVVDSDDWLDVNAMASVMRYLRKQADNYFNKGQYVTDLVIGNYVYEKVYAGLRTPINYTNVFPQRQEFSWDDTGRFKQGQYILMHSAIYRTELLRDCGIKLPKHTFYVDNIFVYVPLPYVETIYYINADMYRYFIGRDDQSVNEEVMLGRVDQQIKITKVMIDSTRYQDMGHGKLRKYMVSYLAMMMCICNVFLRMKGDEEHEQKRQEVWQYLKQTDRKLHDECRRKLVCVATSINGNLGGKIAIWAYHLAQKFVTFN